MIPTRQLHGTALWPDRDPVERVQEISRDPFTKGADSAAKIPHPLDHPSGTAIRRCCW